MFITEDSDSIGVPGFFGEGSMHWKGVSRVLRSHWYHLTVRITEQGSSTEFTRMIEGEHRLQQMLVQQNAGEVIVDVQVVTPQWMNNCDGWGMDRVVKVTVGYDDDDFEVCLIEVANGLIYHSSHCPDFQIEALKNRRPIFLETMIRSA
ncbi:hypothetical protein AOA59_00985 [Pseudomonas sp. 2822-15]|uniref:hypothetical protein n=1 Tax=Pseudomonas sp. 2822-15 TaxID=1712677 RepID=UPI000C14B44A|nr:hypothetical protein [Pseudomonas sp. 2822-15]PIB47421.1 hypothetical protein AOA59_00985 [Pseudomonas sp. 2822-15]